LAEYPLFPDPHHFSRGALPAYNPQDQATKSIHRLISVLPPGYCLILHKNIKVIYPDNFEVKTGFQQIRNMLQRYCLNRKGAAMAMQTTFTDDFNVISRLTGTAAEMVYLLRFTGNFPAQDYYDLSDALLQIRVPGTFCEPETLSELRLSLIAITDIIRYLNKLDDGNFPYLKSLTPESLPDQSIVKKIESIIDDKSEIRDKASEKLFSIRKEIRSRISGVDRRINQILTTARREGIAQDDTELTIRNGRLVIPLPASNKRKLNGYVHDTSATGHTVFVEPAEVFEINNEIQNLRVEEKQEVARILVDLADFLRPFINDLLHYYSFLGEMDFIRAKALLAIEIGAVRPELINEPMIQWRKAVHPLLMIALKQQGRKIVDQDIDLSGNQRIMVISGPNAGGKSVCLKTAGLLQYMLQCGLLIPVSDDSKAGIFSKIFLEIGDEQSLENDLSTYSSHLIHIRNFIENSDRNSLILIDEFGAGTEPQLGGAMAEASLEKLNENGCFGIITTHYTNLKLMADKFQGVFNAAMLYDTQAMQPLFKLSPGKPGSSFAFEIAKKIGFPEKVLINATSKISQSQLDFEKQLAQLEVDKKFIEQKTAELKVADETLSSLVNRYETLLKNLESQRNEMLKEARNKAQQILEQSNRMIENTIRQIKESKADKEKTRALREKLEEEKTGLISDESSLITETKTFTIAPQDKEPLNKPGGKPGGPLKKGSFVRMEGQETIGKIEEIRGKQASVLFGSVKLRINIEKLVPATYAEIRSWEAGQRFSKPPVSVIHQLNDKMADFKMSIDIRGKKADEAQEAIVRYIDQAILLRVNEVRILHGKGDGVLRNILHAYLRDTPEVVRFEDESLERGGHGVTLVYFR
jgi:DNA mismatch repair protein MutS2